MTFSTWIRLFWKGKNEFYWLINSWNFRIRFLKYQHNQVTNFVSRIYVCFWNEKMFLPLISNSLPSRFCKDPPTATGWLGFNNQFLYLNKLNETDSFEVQLTRAPLEEQACIRSRWSPFVKIQTVNRSWRISTTPNTTKIFLIIFKLQIQTSKFKFEFSLLLKSTV